MNPTEFGRFLSAERKAKGLTQRELADAAGVSDKAVSKWERGVCLPDIAKFADIAAALDLTELELLKARRIPAAAPVPALPDDTQNPTARSTTEPGPLLGRDDARRMLLGCACVTAVCFLGDVLELRGLIPVQGLFWLLQTAGCALVGVVTARRGGPVSVGPKAACLYTLSAAGLLALTALFSLQPWILWDAADRLLPWTLRLDWETINYLARYHQIELSIRGVWAKFVTEALLNQWSVAGFLLCPALFLTLRLVRAVRGKQLQFVET